MNDAPYLNWTSATFWAGLAMVGFGIFQCVSGDMAHGSLTISEGLAIIGARRAIGASGGLSKK